MWDGCKEDDIDWIQDSYLLRSDKSSTVSFRWRSTQPCWYNIQNGAPTATMESGEQTIACLYFLLVSLFPTPHQELCSIPTKLKNAGVFFLCIRVLPITTGNPDRFSSLLRLRHFKETVQIMSAIEDPISVLEDTREGILHAIYDIIKWYVV